MSLSYVLLFVLIVILNIIILNQWFPKKGNSAQFQGSHRVTNSIEMNYYGNTLFR